MQLMPRQLMQFAPIRIDDDELMQEIVDEPAGHDDRWVLNERPDSNELENFWCKVENDISNDPEWVKISESDG